MFDAECHPAPLVSRALIREADRQIGGTAKGHLVREIRCPGRPDGAGDRRHRHSVQAPEPKPRRGGPFAARAGGQRGLQPLDSRGPAPGTPNRLDYRPGRPSRGGAEPHCRRGAGGGRRRDPFTGGGGGRNDRHVPERPDTCRAGATTGRARRRATVASSGRVAQGAGPPVGTAEDRHATAPLPREYRLQPLRGGARRRSAGAVLLPDRPSRSPADCLPSPAHDGRRA